MATTPAILGSMRLGNARLGHATAALTTIRTTRIRIFLGGELATSRFRVRSVQIHDVINETPSTCSLVANAPAPAVGQSLRITINSDEPRLLFAGALEQVDVSYEGGKPALVVYPCSAVDDLGTLKRRIPFGTWTSVSATTVAQALIADFAPGFSDAGIEADLPTVSVILDGSEGFDGALRQLAGLIGGYYFVEDGVVYLFTTLTGDEPDPIDADHPPLNVPPITATTDSSQVRTRVYAKGYGSTVPTDVAAGETILPLERADPFSLAGGRAIVVTQRIAYTGVQSETAGSLVGPGVGPSVAPNISLADGTGLGTGVYRYAYTDVTAAGESVPSPLATVTTGTPSTPTTAPTVDPAFNVPGSNGNIAVGDSVEYAHSWSTAASVFDFTQETDLSPGTTVTIQAHAVTGDPLSPLVTVPEHADPRVRFVHFWQAVNGAPFVLMLLPGGLNGYSNRFDGGEYSGWDSGSTSQTHTTATLNRTAVSGIAVGATGTTSRKVYRTAVGGSQLKLLTTLADNTTTTYADSTADGSLGANAPTADTSGLEQEDGQVNAGATSIPTASAAPFSSTGGWAIAASHAIRYTGLSGNTLTGIPASGPGALMKTLKYSEHIDPVPALTGVTGLAGDVASGDAVNIWVQRDDLSAQGLMAAMDGGDGVYEYFVSDERRNELTITALADANLRLYGRPIVTVRYVTMDVKTKSGKPITITLAALDLDQTLTIQDVTISDLDIVPGLPPRFAVTASSVRFSLEALLRQLTEKAA